MVISILIAFFLLVVVPTVVGGLFPALQNTEHSLYYRWVSGQMILWAGFQLICVPFILREEKMHTVIIGFCVYGMAMILLAIGKQVKMRAEYGKKARIPSLVVDKRTGILWLIFFALLLFQLLQVIRLAYGDGDDAYFVAISSTAVSSDTMYTTSAYRGLPMEIDIRHGLAPFPIWIAMIAKLSGLPVTFLSHVMIPIDFIVMTYCVFYLVATELFDKKEQIPLFMILTEILVLFGGYSMYSTETFMIARSRQGKAALGSIVIPFLLFLLIHLLRKLESGEKIQNRFYLLVLSGVTAGCLCSTLGALLCCMLLGITGLIGFFLFRNKKNTLLLAPCCLPCVVYAFIYLLH